jgi:LmbE family N-acetylglucosaminyl deacetylase
MKILVIAPHPDDELLGCGGTLLRKLDEGYTIAWLLMTTIAKNDGWSEEKVKQRNDEIQLVMKGLKINKNNFYSLNFSTTKLDHYPINSIVSKISLVINEFKPQEILIPFAGDVHSDHRITFDAASACTKWFRNPSVIKVMAYETPSETDFSIDPRYGGFQPNIFVNIEQYIDRKIELVKIYKSEIDEFPFPRSDSALRALSIVRGSQSGFKAAEGFMLLKELKK